MDSDAYSGVTGINYSSIRLTVNKELEAVWHLELLRKMKTSP